MVAEIYERPPEIAAEFAALPDENDPEYLNRLRAARFEVLLIARRGAPNEALRRRINDIVADRVVPRIHRSFRTRGGVPEEQRPDLKSEAVTMFWEAIQGESFFEVRFNRAMMFLLGQARQNVLGRKRSGGRVASLDATAEAIPDPEDAYKALEIRMDIQQALEALPGDQRLAYALHYVIRLPIFSPDPAVLTVASVFSCRERKARQIMADTNHALRPWLEPGGP